MIEALKECSLCDGRARSHFTTGLGRWRRRVVVHGGLVPHEGFARSRAKRARFQPFRETPPAKRSGFGRSITGVPTGEETRANGGGMQTGNSLSSGIEGFLCFYAEEVLPKA